MSKKIRLDQAQVVRGSRYPAPYDAPCRERMRYQLGDVAGLSQFGVNFTRLSCRRGLVEVSVTGISERTSSSMWSKASSCW